MRAVALVERTARATRPQDYGIDLGTARPCEEGGQQAAADSSVSIRRLHVTVREVSMTLGFAWARVRDLVEETEPDVADDHPVGCGDPAAPVRIAQVFAHPRRAAREESCAGLGGAAGPKAEFVTESREHGRIGRMCQADLNAARSHDVMLSECRESHVS